MPDNSLRFGRLRSRKQSGVFDGTRLSKSNFYRLCSQQKTLIHLIPKHHLPLQAPRCPLCRGVLLLFLIQFKAVWWLMANTRLKPRDELHSWAARSTKSCAVSPYRRVFITPLKPQLLHLYRGLPTALLPLRTNPAEPHFLQLVTSDIIFLNKNTNYS